MAIEFRTYLVDDLELTQHSREVIADETIRFSVGNRSWEIDLTSANKERLLASLGPYQRAGRRLRTGRPRPVAARRRSAEIRTWAKTKGLPVSENGRIPAGVIASYEKDNPG
jgi:hypothetical protein